MLTRYNTMQTSAESPLFLVAGDDREDTGRTSR